MIPKFVAVSVLAGATFAALAVEVTSEQAETAVRNWIGRGPRRLGAKFGSADVQNTVTGRDGSNRALYHAVNLQGGGFVITSGDTRVTPVVAFSDTGNYDPDTVDPLRTLLQYDQMAALAVVDEKEGQVKFSSAASGVASPFAKEESEWASLLGEPGGLKRSGPVETADMDDVCVYTMLKTRWTQRDEAFNYYTPHNYPCGCVATAGAQLMKYWEWPASVGRFSKLCYEKSVVESKSSKAGPIDWQRMHSVYTKLDPEVERQAVGRLTYNVGVAVGMNWGPNGSGVIGPKLADALKEHFKYASGRSERLGLINTGVDVGGPIGDFKSIVYPNLDAGMPVVLNVREDYLNLLSNGHAVVLDGYGYCNGTRYTHVNMGWPDAGDCWYNLVHEKLEKYECYASLEYNIHPTLKFDNIISGRVTTLNGRFSLAGVKVEYCRSSGQAMMTTTTNSKGIFFFRGPSLSGEHIIRATYGSATASKKFSVDDPPNYWVPDIVLDVPKQGDFYDPDDDYAWCKNQQEEMNFDSRTRRTSEHTLSSTDLCDFFEIKMFHGYTYVMESTGSSKLSATLYNSPYADESSKVAYSSSGGDGGNFKLVYPAKYGTYYLKVAATTPGADASYRISYYRYPGDSYDPADDTAANGTQIYPGRSEKLHTNHVITEEDVYDCYRIYMNAGMTYVLESTGSDDTIAELFSSPSLDSSTRVAGNDNGGDEYNFKIRYTPKVSQTYYLRVSSPDITENTDYSLAYSCAATYDSFDPADDTSNNGTVLSVATAVNTHGVHTLSASDPYDFFRVELSAGRKYVFESTGDFDLYGELFNSTSTNVSNRVSYDDDSGSDRNFKLEYTPSVSQTYYLRVRHLTPGSDASYFLKYSYAPNRHTVSFNANGGSPTPSSVQIEDGNAIGSAHLTSPSKSGYVFDGWWTASTGGSKVTASWIVTGDMTCWAHWRTQSPPKRYEADLIFCDTSGVGFLQWYGYTGEPIGGPLPYPGKKRGYTFAGWYRGDELLTENSLFDAAARSATSRWNEIKATVNGYSWKYYLNEDGSAILCDSGGYSDSPGIEPAPSGAVTVPSSLGGHPVVEIGSHAFYKCTGLTSVTIPSSVKVIGEYAFYGCSGLKSISGMQGVKSIEGYAFYECTALPSITIPGNVESIGDWAFYKCTSLGTVTLSSGVKSLGVGAFSYCTNLKTVTIPASVTKLGVGAFYQCKSLVNLTMAPAERSEWAEAFTCCYGLAKGDFLVVDGVLYGYFGSSSSVSVPDGVKYISSGSFVDWDELKVKPVTAITLPSSIIGFANDAFSGTGLSTVNLTLPYELGNDATAQIAKVKSAVEASGYNKTVAYKLAVRVTFDSLGGSPDTTSIDVQAGSTFGACVAKVSQPKRLGNDFDGWWTEPFGGQQIASSAVVKGNIVCYAHWKRSKDCYTVEYHKYDGSGEFVDHDFVAGTESGLLWLDSQLEWKRDGYEFVGWVPWNPDTKPRLCKYVNGQKVKDLAKAGETIHLYAGWKSPSSYRVCFHLNDGTDVKMNQVILRNKEDSLAWMDSQIGWTRPGYTFNGWAESATGAVKYANGAKVKNLAMDGGTKHLYAVWALKSNAYVVEYHRYDGSGEVREQEFKVGETKNLLWFESQLGWSRPGYEFVGWVPWNPDTKPRLCKYVNGQQVKDIGKPGVKVNLWAAWKSKSSYRVCFNRNDGTGVKMNQVILRNKEDNLAWMDSQIGWMRNGYVFQGWAETANGTGKYANGAKVKNLAMDGGTKHLYAVWKAAKNGAKYAAAGAQNDGTEYCGAADCGVCLVPDGVRVIEGELSDGSGVFCLVMGEDGAVLYLGDGEGWAEEKCEAAPDGDEVVVTIAGEPAYRITFTDTVPVLR